MSAAAQVYEDGLPGTCGHRRQVGPDGDTLLPCATPGCLTGSKWLDQLPSLRVPLPPAMLFTQPGEALPKSAPKIDVVTYDRRRASVDGREVWLWEERA